MTLYLDVHEPLSVQLRLEEKGIKVERKSLTIGDIVFGEYCIERKDIDDFYNSIYNGRLYNQLFNMSINYDRPLLIVIGELPRISYKKLSREEQKRKYLREYSLMKTHLVVSYNSYRVPLYWVKTEYDYVDIVSKFYIKSTNKKLSYKQVKKKSKSIKDVKKDILMIIPGIGPKLACKISKLFTIRELAVSDIESHNYIKLKSIIGEKKAQFIREVLNT